MKKALLTSIDYINLESNKSDTSIHSKLLSFDQSNIQGSVFLTLEGNIFIVFRGSDEIQDYIDDVNIFQTQLILPYDNMRQGTDIKIHSGFISAYKKIRHKLREKLSTICYKHSKAQIIFTGHSLGGALASLAALDLQYHHQNDQPIVNRIQVHSFGAPRIGNAAFAISYNHRVPQTVRVVHSRDPIPWHPSRLIGYIHTKQFHGLGRLYSWGWLLPNVSDHRLDSYQSALQQKEKSS